MHYPAHLQKLIAVLRRLPGVGGKSAERFAFDLLEWPHEHLHEMADVVLNLKKRLRLCPICSCLIDETACPFCTEERQSTGLLCVTAYPRDVFAVETTREYKGLYHVLGGLLSPLQGFDCERLSLGHLKQRIQSLSLKEVVIALDSTLEGDATALYLRKELEPFQIPVSRLAFGLPMGSSLDYVDGGTLARAFTSRSRF